jgi:hypothetical protein
MAVEVIDVRRGKVVAAGILGPLDPRLGDNRDPYFQIKFAQLLPGSRLWTMRTADDGRAIVDVWRMTIVP